MQEHSGRTKAPVFFGQQLLEVHLDFLGVLFVGQLQAPSHPTHMRVHNDAGLVKALAQNQVGGFTPHAWQTGQLFHSLGNHAPEAFDQMAAAGLDRAGFVAVEAGGPHDFFDFFRKRLGQGGRVGPALKKPGSHLVDAFVGALGRENGGDHQLERATMIQFDLGLRNADLQAFQDLTGSFLTHRCAFAES